MRFRGGGQPTARNRQFFSCPPHAVLTHQSATVCTVVSKSVLLPVQNDSILSDVSSPRCQPVLFPLARRPTRALKRSSFPFAGAAATERHSERQWLLCKGEDPPFGRFLLQFRSSGAVCAILIHFLLT